MAQQQSRLAVNSPTWDDLNVYLFICLSGARKQLGFDKIKKKRETDKTHDQLQAGTRKAGIPPTCQLPKLPSSQAVSSTGPRSPGRSVLLKSPPTLHSHMPLPPRSPQACAQLLSLIIKSNKLFSIDLHAGSSAVQKPTPAQPKNPANQNPSQTLTLKTE